MTDKEYRKLIKKMNDLIGFATELSVTHNLNINVHTCGYAFCKECKKKLNEFTGEKLTDYERKLVEEFIKE